MDTNSELHHGSEARFDQQSEPEQWVEPRRKSKRRHRRGRGRSPDEIRAAKRQKRQDAKKQTDGRAESMVALHRRDDPRLFKSVRFAPGAMTTLRLPEVFSLIDAPEDSTKFLKELSVTAAAPSTKHVSLKANSCRNIGLDALVAMSVIILRAKRSRTKENPLSVSGNWPEDLPMQIMFKASGIPHHLGLPEARLSPEHERLVHRCELFSGKSAKKRYALALQRNEATQAVRNYFDRCLNTIGFTLTRQGKNHLDKLVSEVIGNAEEHGGPWYTIGHWQLAPAGDAAGEGTRYGICHIAMFNFGSSIFESFLSPDASPRIVEQLRSLSDLHTKRGWFERLRGSWDEETLWTLYAMQERVSRFSGLPGNETRGNGTRDIVEFFSKLGNPGTMSVVSGHAYLLFDGAHEFHDIDVGGEKLKVITFNSSGTLEEPPDTRYVRRLPNSFPGTMISVRLKLDEQYLTRLTGKQK
jgi:hypothetical protein